MPAEDVPTDEDVLDELFGVIEERKRTQPEGSYTASLFTHDKGQDAALEKLGEEATEFILAAKDGDTDGMTHEGADLVYHLLVVMAMHDLTVDDLRAELATRRH